MRRIHVFCLVTLFQRHFSFATNFNFKKTFSVFHDEVMFLTVPTVKNINLTYRNVVEFWLGTSLYLFGLFLLRRWQISGWRRLKWKIIHNFSTGCCEIENKSCRKCRESAFISEVLYIAACSHNKTHLFCQKVTAVDVQVRYEWRTRKYLACKVGRRLFLSLRIEFCALEARRRICKSYTDTGQNQFEPENRLISYDLESLFTNMPVSEALEIV